MLYKDFLNMEWGKATAYIMGLIFTRIDLGHIVNSSTIYCLGQISHNSNMATRDQIISHQISLTELIEKDGYTTVGLIEQNDNIKIIKSNSSSRKSGKKGFCLVLKIDDSTIQPYKNGNNIEYLKLKEQLHTDLMYKISTITNNVLPYFIAGTIDGRSSYDTTAGYISIDIDRNYDRQREIEKLLNMVGIKFNINTRGNRVDVSKADQLRYDDAKYILQNIPLISDIRKNNIISHIGE